MNRNEALQWCIDNLECWPSHLDASGMYHHPTGWEWDIRDDDEYKLRNRHKSLISERGLREARKAYSIASYAKRIKELEARVAVLLPVHHAARRMHRFEGVDTPRYQEAKKDLVSSMYAVNDYNEASNGDS